MVLLNFLNCCCCFDVLFLSWLFFINWVLIFIIWFCKVWCVVFWVWLISCINCLICVFVCVFSCCIWVLESFVLLVVLFIIDCKLIFGFLFWVICCWYLLILVVILVLIVFCCVWVVEGILVVMCCVIVFVVFCVFFGDMFVSIFVSLLVYVFFNFVKFGVSILFLDFIVLGFVVVDFGIFMLLVCWSWVKVFFIKLRINILFLDNDVSVRVLVLVKVGLLFKFVDMLENWVSKVFSFVFDVVFLLDVFWMIVVKVFKVVSVLLEILLLFCVNLFINCWVIDSIFFFKWWGLLLLVIEVEVLVFKVFSIFVR